MSLFASPSRKYKKVFPQVEADKYCQSDLLLGRKKQANLHSSSAVLILRKIKTKFDPGLELMMPIEIRFGFRVYSMEIQRFKETWKEIQKNYKYTQMETNKGVIYCF